MPYLTIFDYGQKFGVSLLDRSVDQGEEHNYGNESREREDCREDSDRSTAQHPRPRRD